ncbi:hypothetical protein PR202_gb20364 [Eleusine coracana subsp. coracana]|uniref:Uncharacterized protein n=1 Tax=Eleusine coracana subsp. coracana TaxID=191504 RepID=A0AAV5FAL7_ELECO|nr:hypothetical protein PR202_gb20364 [Eleusine coracana subsp. coracana]
MELILSEHCRQGNTVHFWEVLWGYDDQVGLSESTKSQFWKDLDSMVSAIPISEKLFIGGDLNGHVGASNVGDKRTKTARTKWWKIRGELAQTFKEKMLGEGPWEEGEGPDDMWLRMATCVQKVASEVFGVSRGGKQEAKDTWWWNDEVQRAIKEECFKRLHLDKSEANIEGYKIAKRAAKRAMSVVKG